MARKRSKGESPENNSWRAMLMRCNDPRNSAYKSYGARGIRVCSRWSSFKSFLEDMGPRPPGTTLDRINNKIGYRPSNCRWATPRQQAANMRTTLIVEFEGQKRPLCELAHAYGLTPARVYQRHFISKWTLEESLGITPPPERRIGGRFRGRKALFGGRNLTAYEIANETGIPYGTIWSWISTGKDVEKLVFKRMKVAA